MRKRKEVLVGVLVCFLLVVPASANDNFPKITNFQVTPTKVHSGGVVKISADISDDFGIKEVYLKIYGGDCGYYYGCRVKPKWRVSGNHYETIYKMPINTGKRNKVYEIKILAKDTAGQTTQTRCKKVIVTPDKPSDREPPKLSDPLISPSCGKPGTRFRIKVRVHDESGVAKVTARVHVSGTKYIDMDLYSGNPRDGYWVCYFRTQASTPPGKYKVDFYALDKAGNYVVGAPEYFEIKGADKNNPPQLFNAYVKPKEVNPGFSGVFEYYVTYRDRDGDRPAIIQVNVDGSGGEYAFDMYYVRGSITSGALYKARVPAKLFPTALTPGSKHYFYVYASDGKDSVWTNVMEGPIVKSSTEKASILSVATDKSTYVAGDTVKVKVTVKNTGNAPITNLRINVDVAGPSGKVRQGVFKSGISLSPGETYSTGFLDCWRIENAKPGRYFITVGLWGKGSTEPYDIRYRIESFKVVQAERWWESEAGIQAVASLLKEKYHGGAVEIVKNERYILFAVLTDLETKDVEGVKIDVPVYKSFLFDKNAKKFLTSDRAKDIAFDLYLQNLLEQAKPQSTLKALTTVIRNDANSLLSAANNPWITVGGSVVQQICAGGQALAKLLVTENPEQALESLVNAETEILIAIAEAEGVEADIRGNEKVQETLEVLEELKKARNSYDKAKTLIETSAFAGEAWKKVGEAAKKLKVGKEYTSKATKMFTSTFMDYAASELFPAGTITKTTLYMEFSGQHAWAAIELANYAEEQWKRDRTWNGYVNSFLALAKAYNELAHAYEFNAMALRENRGGWTGCIAEFLHDLTNSVKVEQKIEMAEKSAEDRAKSGVRVFIYNVGSLYIRAASASSNLLDPHLNFKQSKAGISCRVTPGVYKPGEKVKFTVRIRNCDRGSYRVMLGIKYPDGEVKYLTKTVRINKGLKEVPFEWMVPRDAKSGRYGVAVSLWSGSKNCGTWLKENAFSVNSLMGKVDVSCTPGRYTFKDIVRIDVRIRNTGTDANFELHTKIMRGSSVVSSTERRLFIKSGETETVPLFWHVGDCKPGRYSIKVDISSGGKVLDSKLIEGVFEVVKVNKPPSVSRVKSERVIKTHPGNVKFRVSVKDEDGNLRKVEWYVDGVVVKEENTSGTATLTDFEYDFGEGRHYVVARAYDSEGYSYVSWVVVATNPKPKPTPIPNPVQNTIRAEDIKVKKGETSKLAVYADTEKAVGAVQLNLKFDPSVVEAKFVSAASGSLLASKIDNRAGVVKFGVASSEGIRGKVVEIEFYGKAEGFSPVQISVVDIVDTSNNPLNFKVVNGSVEVYKRIKGDANDDGRITAGDALLYLRYAVGQDISPYHLDSSDDVTGDGRITASDALKVLKVAVGGGIFSLVLFIF